MRSRRPSSKIRTQDPFLSNILCQLDKITNIKKIANFSLQSSNLNLSVLLPCRFIFELLDVAALGDEALDKFEFESIQTSVSAFMGKDNHKGLSATPENTNASNKKKNSGDKKEKKTIASNKGGGGGGFGSKKQ